MTDFGDYELIERIASGGMAELFLARQTGLGGFSKTVVIKRIHKHLSADYEFTTMFINEARVSAQLSHQNIVQIHHFGEHEGNYFIAMEYVYGQDLKGIYKLCRKKGMLLQLPICIYIIQQVCMGLDYAHRKCDSRGVPLDIVHRDVSPQNILISYEGEVKVADFGIAKAASSTRMTQAGTLKGKIAYMSPEQAWGKQVDKRSDIFSIAIVFWEILTNQRLFYGSSDFDTLERVRNCELPDIKKVVPDLPKEIVRILHKGLTKDPAMRYYSASEMHHDLDVFSAAHGFYNQSPDLASFLRSHFLESKPESHRPGSRSSSRVFVSTGLPGTGPVPTDRFEEKTLESRPSALPPVAQKVVAKAKGATQNSESDSLYAQTLHDDATYQAPPLSQDLFKEEETARGPDGGGTAAVASPSPDSTDKVVGGNPALGALVSPKGAAEGAPWNPEEWAEDQWAEEQWESSALGAETHEETSPNLDDEESEAWDEDELGWEEELPRSSMALVALIVVLLVALGAVGGVGYYVLREKGMLPPDWLPPGRLSIQSVPEAKVFLNGRDLGVTDHAGRLEAKDLRVGVYELSVGRDGYEEWSSRVRVRPNRVIPVAAYPSPIFGSLVVRVDQPHARIYIDSVYYSRVSEIPSPSGFGYTLSFDTIPIGEHLVTVAKKGFLDQELRVAVSLDSPARADFRLLSASAPEIALIIKTDQNGSFAILDGVGKGIISPDKPLSISFTQGIHDLTVVKARYDPATFRRARWSSETLEIEFKPATLSGAVFVDTDLQGYHLLVDGKEILRSIKGGATLPGIPLGQHRIEMVHPRYGRESQEVLLVRSKIRSLRFSLGQIEIETSPPKATILIDGELKGVSPLMFTIPNATDFELMVTLPGYRPYRERLETEGLERKINLELHAK